MAIREFHGELDDPADEKDGIRLAGGGFLGGNLGIAMGAGVQQMNRQRQLDYLEADQRLAKEAASAAAGVKQEQVTAYTPEQAAQLHAVANAKNPETGGAVYSVEHDGSKYVVRNASESTDATGEAASSFGSGKSDGVFSFGQSPGYRPSVGQSSNSNPVAAGSLSQGIYPSDLGTDIKAETAFDVARPEPKTAIGKEARKLREMLEARKAAALEIAPQTQYRLGSRTQDKPFSDADIRNEQLSRMSDAFMLAGRADKSGQVEELLAKRRKAAEEAERRAVLAKAGEGGVDNLLKVAPDIAFEYIRSGEVDKAKKFIDFADSMDGRDYARSYAKAHHLTTIGDYEGALPIFEKLYNELYPDGREVKLSNLGNGKYQASFIDQQTGGIVGSQELPVSQLARDAVSALSPTKLVEHLVTQGAKRDAEESLLDRQLQLEDVRQRGREFSEDRKDNRLVMRLENAAKQGPKLSLAQEVRNYEIDSARKRIANMSAEELRRKTAPTTATGRENPQYDPLLARDAKLASRRKYGSDDTFDTKLGEQESAASPSASNQGNDVSVRFQSDPEMKGKRLGKQTPHGIEVFDGAGKLIGHYE